VKDWELEKNSVDGGMQIPNEFTEVARIDQLDAYLCHFVTEAQHKDGSPLSLLFTPKSYMPC